MKVKLMKVIATMKNDAVITVIIKEDISRNNGKNLIIITNMIMIITRRKMIG